MSVTPPFHRSGIPSTIADLISRHALAQPDAPALLAVDRAMLTYGELWQIMLALGDAFGQLGIRPLARVAIVIPNGPELAVAFLAAACNGIAAPLNPSLTVQEFGTTFEELGIDAVVVWRGFETAARLAATARAIPVFEADASAGAPAGRFTLAATANDVSPNSDEHAPDTITADHVALILQTSGTTARPKKVPLTHQALLASAGQIAASFALTPSDRCLNIMPLFHVHGLVAALLASLHSGASLVCTPGLQPEQVLGWMSKYQPSWYTAVPTMHQAILAQAAQDPAAARTTSLRFIRSCSAALPPSVMTELERVFGVPVVESYGMTEAAHQMASNPLPPAVRKPSSVGCATGTQVAIMDAAGRLLSSPARGEVVIRGPNVMRGYEHNPDANAAAFVSGWFRTGDEGYLDAEGYLFLTGRLKEMINRGGEKIAPREIDEVLLRHPAVVHALAFAIPHPTLGEDVAAAVVLRPNADVVPETLREFASAHLPEFKVPTRFVFLDEIPKGPTGKPQRIGLADRLALDWDVAHEPPQGELETLIASVFESLLKRPVGRQTSFFAAGGDSIRAAQAIARLQAPLSLQIQASSIFRNPTPARFAREMERLLALARPSQAPAKQASSISP